VHRTGLCASQRSFAENEIVERIPYVIIACCVLQNACIFNNDLFDVQSDDIEENVDIINGPSNDDDRNVGVRKRLDFTRTL